MYFSIVSVFSAAKQKPTTALVTLVHPSLTKKICNTITFSQHMLRNTLPVSLNQQLNVSTSK